LTASQREQAVGPGERYGDAEARVLAGCVAAVTGGGRGLGRAIALALAEAGADVVVAARSAGEIGQVAGEVGKRGVRSLSVPTDITDEEAVEQLVALTRTAGVEWARYGVQINAIAPGYVETDMNQDVRDDEELYSRVLAQIPAKRMARTEEIGPLAVYLASSASDFMTGETIVIDGGETAK
jgi:NAD(P)-dependent dehydrogenase (short-subunit alcohol dehydrogenase family)